MFNKKIYFKSLALLLGQTLYMLINHHKIAKTEYLLLYNLVNSYVLTEISNVGLPRQMLAMAKNGWFQRD